MSKLLSSFLLALVPSVLPKDSTGKIVKTALSWRILLIVACFYVLLPLGCAYFADSPGEYAQCVSDVNTSVEDTVEDTMLGGN
jgi:hypothetical protein